MTLVSGILLTTQPNRDDNPSFCDDKIRGNCKIVNSNFSSKIGADFIFTNIKSENVRLNRIVLSVWEAYVWEAYDVRLEKQTVRI